MKLNQILASLTAAALTFCMGAAVAGVQAEESEKLRVMPLGDSITDGFTVEGGYRNPLWSMLEENGYADSMEFVGPNWGGTTRHAGYSGYAIADIEGKRSGIYNFIDWLMTDYPADVVMLQIGTNDILSSCTDGMGDRLELLVDSILTYIPEDGLLYVATIPYMDADVTTYTDAYTVEEMDAAVDDYNADVRALVQKKQAEGYPVALSDINSVLTKADLGDGVHPSQEGYNKMGAYWYEKLVEYIGGDLQLPTASTEETSAQDTTQATEATTEPTEPTPTYIREGNLYLTNLPDQLTFAYGEPLDLTGLTVSLEFRHDGFEEYIYEDVSPVDHYAFEIDTHEVDHYGWGVCTIYVRVTDSTKSSYNVYIDEVSFQVTITEPVRSVKGDLNLDGTQDILDVIILQKFLLGAGTLDLYDPYAADMNEDGDINVFDLVYLKRAVLHI